jgi:peroxiredoxin
MFKHHSLWPFVRAGRKPVSTFPDHAIERTEFYWRTQKDRIMAIKIGDRVPSGSFTVMTAEGPKPLTTDELFKGKKVVLFAVPGAFTPTCHRNHLPGFVKNAAAIKAKGVDTIAVTGVNDVFVMDAWKKASGGDAIEFLADGSGSWAKAMGLTMDLSERGLGVRSQRYAMLVQDGVIKALNVEDAPGKAEISGADNILKAL